MPSSSTNTSRSSSSGPPAGREASGTRRSRKQQVQERKSNIRLLNPGPPRKLTREPAEASGTTSTKEKAPVWKDGVGTGGLVHMYEA